jgi:small subunit ribosomal protein S8
MDPISDMMTRITNAQAVSHERVSIPFSNVKHSIAQLLLASGYISGVERVKRKARVAEVEYLDLTLKYLPADGQAGAHGLGAISGVKLVSRPSRHLYLKARDIRPVRSGFGMAVMSTPKGILSGSASRKENVGGEIMFEIW